MSEQIKPAELLLILETALERKGFVNANGDIDITLTGQYLLHFENAQNSLQLKMHKGYLPGAAIEDCVVYHTALRQFAQVLGMQFIEPITFEAKIK